MRILALISYEHRDMFGLEMTQAKLPPDFNLKSRNSRIRSKSARLEVMRRAPCGRTVSAISTSKCRSWSRRAHNPRAARAITSPSHTPGAAAELSPPEPSPPLSWRLKRASVAREV